MHTKLYKMWVSFCKDISKDMDKPEQRFQYTYVSFSYSRTTLIKIHSNEYYAWYAFQCANPKFYPKSQGQIIRFIIENFKAFKRYFPCTCVFFDMHMMKPYDILDQMSCNSMLAEEFKKALVNDIDSRKSRQ